MPFTEYSCACGCPWEGYDSIEDADQWRRDDWIAALENSDHDEHEWAWVRLQDYIKEKWMDMLDDFFNEAGCDAGFDGKYKGKAIIPRTTQEMIDTVLDDESTDFFQCEDCSDNTNGWRCYRNRPQAKKQKRSKTNAFSHA